ncbi:MAG: replication initiation protein RepC, partial [Hyphomicrobiales bacterium]|nr:replication initiation protein RepC [Hyphomicrobiales bacterium]
METYSPTTPFGRRTLSLTHLASQVIVKERPPDATAHKWTVFRAICEAKDRLGLADRALAVLNALLSFHPETALSGDNLVVFPSNDQLALRAHGMPPSTLRRCLAALVDAGVIIRRDSPNGKRYARKSRGGAIAQAFGFDLSPLTARAAEFEALAEQVRAEERALRLARERITLCRRDIAKMIATGIEEGVPTGRAGEGDWGALHALYRTIVGRIPRSPTLAELEPIARELSRLADRILNLLETHVKTSNSNANESHNERHIQNSNPESKNEFEPAYEKAEAAPSAPQPPAPKAAETVFPLGMVLDACPDMADYARGGIVNWRDFVATAVLVRSMLGVSPSAWEEAVEVMGERQAAVVVAAILQRGEAIVSAGGYLRDLTQKAQKGQFSL